MTGRSRKSALPATIVLGMILLACAGLRIAAQVGPDIYHWMQQQGMPGVGSSAPDFSLLSLEGEVTRLSQFQGKPVLLTFGESWCSDCRTEAPVLQRLHESHPELTVLMVDKEEAGLALKFASDFGMTFPVLLDKGGTTNHQYRIYGIPTTYFIDADGIIRGVIIEGTTEKILAEKLPLIGVEP